MISVYKKGRDGKKASSYSPISMTSCTLKIVGTVVNSGLMWCLELEDILSQEQTGFRQFKGTEDQATFLSKETEYAVQDQKVVFATYVQNLERRASCQAAKMRPHWQNAPMDCVIL